MASVLSGPQGDDSPIGRCLGTAGVNVVLSRAQAALIARGWVASRVLAAPQDLSGGVLALTLDDSGLSTTGRYQGGVTLSADNPLGLNDLFYVNASHSLDAHAPTWLLSDRPPEGTEGQTVHYALPLGDMAVGLDRLREPLLPKRGRAEPELHLRGQEP